MDNYQGKLFEKIGVGTSEKELLNVEPSFTYDDFEEKLQKELGEGIIMYEPDFGGDDIFASLFAKMGENQAKSDAQVLSEYLEGKESGVLMYYAGYER